MKISNNGMKIFINKGQKDRKTSNESQFWLLNRKKLHLELEVGYRFGARRFCGSYGIPQGEMVHHLVVYSIVE